MTPGPQRIRRDLPRAAFQKPSIDIGWLPSRSACPDAQKLGWGLHQNWVEFHHQLGDLGHELHFLSFLSCYMGTLIPTLLSQEAQVMPVQHLALLPGGFQKASRHSIPSWDPAHHHHGASDDPLMGCCPVPRCTSSAWQSSRDTPWPPVQSLCWGQRQLQIPPGVIERTPLPMHRSFSIMHCWEYPYHCHSRWRMTWGPTKQHGTGRRFYILLETGVGEQDRPVGGGLNSYIGNSLVPSGPQAVRL